MSLEYTYTNFSNGWIVEFVKPPAKICESWLLLPAENLWVGWLRGILYLLAMAYMFLGIAITCDVFVCSIERIISKTVVVKKVNPVTGDVTMVEEYFWNETVANLTLMALGSSAPEILLSVTESCLKLKNIDHDIKHESLGLFTICGSAAFNLFVITGICIMSVKSPNIKKIKGKIIFLMNSLWSIWAYIWLLLVSVFISPNEIEPWEAWVTVLFFPIMVVSVYCQNKKWWYHKWKRPTQIWDLMNGKIQNKNPEEGNTATDNIKFEDGEHESEEKTQLVKIGAKTRFTHAKFTQVMGVHNETKKRKQADEVRAVSQISLHTIPDRNLVGKFAFKSGTQSVLESEGKVTIPVLLYRMHPLPNIFKDPDNVPGLMPESIDISTKGPATVDYETLDGSAKTVSDFEYASGTLVFEDGECCKTITVKIVDDPEYEDNKDFYVILKKPTGASTGIGELSITRITIIDDDDPGEFSFDKERYHPNLDGVITVTILRKVGTDGSARMTVLSSDKTAIGGTEFKKGADYISIEQSLAFVHEETSLKFQIQTNVKSDRKKTFSIYLENLSDGCRFGDIHTATCFVGKHNEESEDEEEEEDASWPDQFRNAMTLDRQFDENGNEIQGGFMVYFMHFCSFFWRFLCAFIPPRNYLGAYPAFFGSLLILGSMTTVVEQLGTLLGCVLGIKTEVAGITIVALGTSLQDTFASRAAAVQDVTADNSIGHITGSNAVNVFLGLGLPWVISSMYASARNKHYCVSTDNLFQSIIVFVSLAAMAIFLLIFRRLVFKGELGGPIIIKFGFGIIFVSIWIVYIMVLSLVTYGVIQWKYDVTGVACS